MANKNDGGQRPIIIKKKHHEEEEEHHGGAWKIAYADFVTAMMCIFLVLWLINVTSEAQREGIANYFNPLATRQEAQETQSSFFGGTAPEQVEGRRQSGGSRPVSPPMQSPEVELSRVDQGDQPTQSPTAIAERLRQALKSAGLPDSLAANVLVDMTPRGLRIQIVDSDGFAMFRTGTATLTSRGQKLLRSVNEIVHLMPQDMSVTGHTDARPYEGTQYRSNWELSTARANAARRAMTADDIAADRFQRVEGYADKKPLTADNPDAPQNRRIALLLLRGTGNGTTADSQDATN